MSKSRWVSPEYNNFLVYDCIDKIIKDNIITSKIYNRNSNVVSNIQFHQVVKTCEQPSASNQSHSM